MLPNADLRSIRQANLWASNRRWRNPCFKTFRGCRLETRWSSFRASAQQLLDYHDATYERMKTYLEALSADELARELDEPQYDPRPTVAVRLVSVLENAMTNEGQISYLKAYHRLGGWSRAKPRIRQASASRPLKTQ